MWQADPTLSRDALCRSAAEAIRHIYHGNAINIAQQIYVHIENISRIDMITKGHLAPPAHVFPIFENHIDRVAHHEPLGKILGVTDFYGFPFKVTADTLDPRTDTETLITAILEKYETKRAEKINILDIGTGTGCLAITAAKLFTNAEIIGLDISQKALIVASENAVMAKVQQRCNFMCLELENFNSFECDIIISNPPYIPTGALEYLDPSVRNYDPHIALDGGDDGLDFYRNIARITPNICKNGTDIFLEIGIGQAACVKDIFSAYGFKNFSFYRDDANIIRCVSCTYVDIKD